MASSPCTECQIGWHNECRSILTGTLDSEGAFFICCCEQEAQQIKPTDGVFRRALKEGEAIKDQTSTGRKRAALVKPISPGDICEWSGLKLAGGGVVPIIGCRDNLATNIHHGPDKSTLNNDLENLHKICATCHNRWHKVNDPFYPKQRPEGGAPYLPENLTCKPHDPDTLATEADYEANEKKWSRT